MATRELPTTDTGGRISVWMAGAALVAIMVFSLLAWTGVLDTQTPIMEQFADMLR